MSNVIKTSLQVHNFRDAYNRTCSVLAMTAITRPSVILFVILDYCKSNQPILLKLDAMIIPTNRKKSLTFGGDPVPDTDSGSLFNIPGLAVTGRFSRHSTDADKVMNPQHFGSDFNPGSLLVEVRRLGGGLRSLSTV